jgi:3'(2'), 5'-bisphosphate nucleotidase
LQVDANLLSELVAIAYSAGGAILKLCDSDIGARTKADGSPLTQADLAANETILEGLAGKFPGVPTITEERVPDAVATNTRHVFLVDPLDGTRDFLNGNGEYTVNIALLDGGDPVAGVVYAPALGTIYAGATGTGSRRANIAHHVIGPWEHVAAAAPAGKLHAVTSRSHPSPKTRAYLDKLAIGDVTPIGSSLKFCLIAAGEADIYPRMGQTMEWDTAAGDAILRAAGGTVRDMSGEPLRYNKRDAAGRHDLPNPWFVATGRFDAFDPKWRRKPVGSPSGRSE